MIKTSTTTPNLLTELREKPGEIDLKKMIVEKFRFSEDEFVTEKCGCRFPNFKSSIEIDYVCGFALPLISFQGTRTRELVSVEIFTTHTKLKSQKHKYYRMWTQQFVCSFDTLLLIWSAVTGRHSKG